MRGSAIAINASSAAGPRVGVERAVAHESDLTASKIQPSPQGQALRKWRQESQAFAHFWILKRGRGMFIRPGARALLLAAERGKFLTEQWPRIKEMIQRLGLSAEQLLNNDSKKD